VLCHHNVSALLQNIPYKRHENLGALALNGIRMYQFLIYAYIVKMFGENSNTVRKK
jgi:hypothetical protein